MERHCTLSLTGTYMLTNRLVARSARPGWTLPGVHLRPALPHLHCEWVEGQLNWDPRPIASVDTVLVGRQWGILRVRAVLESALATMIGDT